MKLILLFILIAPVVLTSSIPLNACDYKFNQIENMNSVSGLSNRAVLGYGTVSPATSTYGLLCEKNHCITLPGLGGTYITGQAINNRGDIAGWSTNTDNTVTKAVIWENDLARELETLGGDGGQAMAINNRGDVAGWSNTSGNSNVHATFWQRGIPVDLGSLGTGYNSFAFGINDRGDVVGWSESTGGDRPVLWSHGSAQDLGSFRWGGYAYAINNSGAIVGEAHTGDGVHAILWGRNIPLDLGTFGGHYSAAYDINNNGEIVGYASTLSENPRATIWKDGEMLDLNEATCGATLTLEVATDINDRGEIGGHGVDENGYWHAFLLTPVETSHTKH